MRERGRERGREKKRERKEGRKERKDMYMYIWICNLWHFTYPLFINPSSIPLPIYLCNLILPIMIVLRIIITYRISGMFSVPLQKYHFNNNNNNLQRGKCRWEERWEKAEMKNKVEGNRYFINLLQHPSHPQEDNKSH